MAEKREVSISGRELESVARRFEEFGNQLPPNEQIVVDWLLQRAGSGPMATPQGSAKGSLSAERFTQAVGYGQGLVRPGDLAAVKITISF